MTYNVEERIFAFGVLFTQESSALVVIVCAFFFKTRHVCEKKNGTRRFREKKRCISHFFLIFFFFFFFKFAAFFFAIDWPSNVESFRLFAVWLWYNAVRSDNRLIFRLHAIVPRNETCATNFRERSCFFSFSPPFPVWLFLHGFESFVDLPLVFFLFLFFPPFPGSHERRKRKKKKRKEKNTVHERGTKIPFARTNFVVHLTGVTFVILYLSVHSHYSFTSKQRRHDARTISNRHRFRDERLSLVFFFFRKMLARRVTTLL